MSEKVKLTKAQERCLAILGRPGTHSVAWGHTYAPPKHLVAKGLAEQFGYVREGPVYYITPAGRAALPTPPASREDR